MRDQGLSIEARGTLAVLMTYSDEWEFRRGHLMKIAGVGRDKFARIMRELENAGYVKREPRRGEGGKVLGSQWVIRDDPDREPENQSLDNTEALKNQGPVEPTSGESVPIRRTTDKETLTSSVCAQAKSGAFQFDAFWKTYPRDRDRERTQHLFDKALAEGISAETLCQAAAKYRAENKGSGQQYMCYSDNWLKNRRWEDFPEQVQVATGDNACQSALNVDPLSAPKNDPPFVLSWPVAA